MKKYYIALLAGLFSILSVQAQKNLEVPYNQVKPGKLNLDSIRTVYVGQFKNLNAKSANPYISSLIRLQMIEIFRRNTHEAAENTHAQYQHTDWFLLVDDSTKADAIFKGYYDIVVDEIRDVKEETRTISRDHNYRSPYYGKVPESGYYEFPVGTKYDVPYTVRTHSYANKIDMKIYIQVFDKEGKKLPGGGGFTHKNESALPDAIGRPPSFPSSKTSLYLQANGAYAFYYRYYDFFMPTHEKQTATLFDIRPDDRKLRRELRRSHIRTTEELLKAAKLYTTIYEAEGTNKAAHNAAYLYYLLGYFDEAVAWERKSGLRDKFIEKKVESKKEFLDSLERPLQTMGPIHP